MVARSESGSTTARRGCSICLTRRRDRRRDLSTSGTRIRRPPAWRVIVQSIILSSRSWRSRYDYAFNLSRMSLTEKSASREKEADLRRFKNERVLASLAPRWRANPQTHGVRARRGRCVSPRNGAARASAGPSGSARDAKAVKREKAQKGKAPVVEAVIDLDEEEEDDEFNEQNDADIAQMVRPLYGVFFEHPPVSTENASATHARVVRRVETRRSHHASIASRFRVPTSTVVRAAHRVYLTTSRV